MTVAVDAVAEPTVAEPAAADSPAVLVGQAFALLKDDLIRRTDRSFSLALRPQKFRVGALQVRRAMVPFHQPKNGTAWDLFATKSAMGRFCSRSTRTKSLTTISGPCVRLH